MFIKGYAYLERGDIDQARSNAHQLKRLIDQGMNKKAIKYYHYFLSMIELNKQDFSRSILHFKQALSSLSSQLVVSIFSFSNGQALFIEHIALAYLKSGYLERARQEYEKIISLTAGWLLYGDIYAKSYYNLGRIQEQLGNQEKAIANYQKFLSLWKEADSGLPEVSHARQRLDALKKK